ncbi:hypothetical protein PpBr36_07768 [Pyricularia pennisetigena]|uniref:hypothetical protein n=1 Tax=Pyricularia pennisetigena TaxID=1578925 RepID=UPI001152B61D|nr:hypothetical protein PpBr36_07768 [Pyricularia pennisetigena]TLS25941.1 hypothetical protein PpBr36_07768 [Pyricularia pennisetigena]
MPLLMDGLAYAGAIWSPVVFCVQAIGLYQLFRSYSRPPPPPISPSLASQDVPHVTVIRPVKGLEPQLYECLISTLQQSYPRDKLSVHLCISSKDDPAYPVLKKIVAEYGATHDVRLFVETEDPLLYGTAGDTRNLGPNPKIRNISHAYREAKGDIIWIIDCNIWVSKGTAGRMVDKLCGFPAGSRPYKFVHQLPLSVDVTPPQDSHVLRTGGGRLDEMFMATTHGKFYSAINTVGVAPCICGKSNMFRKSHIDRLTDPAHNPILPKETVSRPHGIDYFSAYICEDHLIGDLLWRSHVPGHGNHGLVFGDLALQPMTNNSVGSYIGRRVRWLRVRKWTVILATLVEPGVESMVCCMAFAHALTTTPWCPNPADWPIPHTWTALWSIWLAAIAVWATMDYVVYCFLHSCRSIENDADSPDFAQGKELMRRPFGAWILAWIGREVLALPIWTRAVLLGTTVTWRGTKFKNISLSSNPFNMDSFVYRNTPSPKVIFGRGTLSSLANEIRCLSDPSGCKKPLLVSSPGRVSLAQEIRQMLGEDGISQVELVSTATVHNPSSVINDALPLAADRDCIVSLGGGSAVGLGKTLALRTGLPHVVIPTTYSGSEMTPILGEKGADGKKVSVTDPKILPTVVIYDVDLTLDLPLKVSFPSGINALAHSIEALYAEHSNPVTSILALESIRSLSSALGRLSGNPKSVQARTTLLRGAFLAGYVVASTGIALQHKLTHAVAGTAGLPHAETHAILLPHSLAYNLHSIPKQTIASLTEAMSPMEVSGSVADLPGPVILLNDLLGVIGIPRALKDLGMAKSDIEKVTDVAMEKPYWNPRSIEKEKVRELIRRAWEGETARADL